VSTIKCTVLGVPCGKGRPKFSTSGGFVRAYTPEKTANYETLVRVSWQQQTNGYHFQDEPLRAYLVAYFPFPKSMTKKRRKQLAEQGNPYTKKPDNDNIAKAVFDALNNVAYIDDSQVVSIEIVKLYDEIPRLEIELKGWCE